MREKIIADSMNAVLRTVLQKTKDDAQALTSMITQADPDATRNFDEQIRLLGEFQAGIIALDALNGLTQQQARETSPPVGAPTGRLPAVNFDELERAIALGGQTQESSEQTDERPEEGEQRGERGVMRLMTRG